MSDDRSRHPTSSQMKISQNTLGLFHKNIKLKLQVNNS